ncbi:hypothetical protein AB1N83_013098 [Pleurotus pulmonarius]
MPHAALLASASRRHPRSNRNYIVSFKHWARRQHRLVDEWCLRCHFCNRTMTVTNQTCNCCWWRYIYPTLSALA